MAQENDIMANPQPLKTGPDGVENDQKPFVLSVQPVTLSLTEGTDIPAPPESPPPSSDDPLRLTTPDGGPLSSHPAADTMPGAYPTTPEPEMGNGEKTSLTSTPATSGINRDRADSFRTPYSPPTAHKPIPSNPTPGPSPRLRRMFSLSSLRQSFSSSRTSLSGSRVPDEDVQRPSSSSMTSNNLASMGPPKPSQPPLRKKRSSSWFRRKSGFFTTVNGDSSTLDVVAEDPRESKRFKDAKSTPFLPEIDRLGGGTLNDGQIGWDEALFKR